MKCCICPHECGADRGIESGWCKADDSIHIAKVMIHHWEEPPISGVTGSGAVFFSGCNMSCVFCQNHEISRNSDGKIISADDLANIFLSLQKQKVHNINLISATHYASAVAEAIKIAKNSGLEIPVIWNSNAYEKVATLRLLDGLIDIFLPDLKYYDDIYAKKYSGIDNYFNIAKKAVLEMYKQTGDCVFALDGILKRGIIIRHLILPGLRSDSMRILDFIKETIPGVYVSLMSQYMPVYKAFQYSEINRKVTSLEYESVVNHFFNIGLKNGYIQDIKSSDTAYVPDFNEKI